MLRVPAHRHNLRGRQQSSSKPGQARAIHKLPSPSAEAAAHWLPRCLLPPSGLHPAMQEEETPATKPVKRREEDSGTTGLGKPQDHPTPSEPHGGHPETSRDQEAKRVGAARPRMLKSLRASRHSPRSIRGFSQASPLHLDRTSQSPERAQGHHQEGTRWPLPPREGLKSVTRLLLRGLCQGGNKKQSYFRGIALS